jgi:hypothetical protein
MKKSIISPALGMATLVSAKMSHPAAGREGS